MPNKIPIKPSILSHAPFYFPYLIMPYFPLQMPHGRPPLETSSQGFSKALQPQLSSSLYFSFVFSTKILIKHHFYQSNTQAYTLPKKSTTLLLDLPCVMHHHHYQHLLHPQPPLVPKQPQTCPSISHPPLKSFWQAFIIPKHIIFTFFFFCSTSFLCKFGLILEYKLWFLLIHEFV